ncbi:MAG: AAA family ATPase, partial [Candidatus Marinimicrobia bacterium]|nr:AAA family ATPase [Candidatus Neomarinimicrobiota bacterium]
MLQHLQIENLAVIKTLDISFKNGMSVITGETGAGKSIVIDALGLILGDRANTLMIREGLPTASVTARFLISEKRKNDIFTILDELNIDKSSEIEIRREISSTGKSRALINNSQINIGDLKRIGSYLVEMHGQHEHQKLLDHETHIFYLDAYIQDDKYFLKFKNLHSRFKKEMSELNRIESDKIKYEKEFELKQYHLKELETLDFQENELQNLQEESRLLEHSEQLNELSGLIADKVYESDNSIVDTLRDIQKALIKISEIDPEQKTLKQELESSLISLRDLGMTMAAYRDNVVFNPQRLSTVRQRINDIYRLEKKHQKSFSELYQYGLDLKKELKEQTDFDTLLKDKKNRLEALRDELAEATLALSSIRKKTALAFSESINAILKKMGMKYA